MNEVTLLLHQNQQQDIPRKQTTERKNLKDNFRKRQCTNWNNIDQNEWYRIQMASTIRPKIRNCDTALCDSTLHHFCGHCRDLYLTPIQSSTYDPGKRRNQFQLQVLIFHKIHLVQSYLISHEIHQVLMLFIHLKTGSSTLMR